MNTSEKKDDDERLSERIKFRRSRTLENFRKKNKYAYAAKVMLGITLYLLFIDPLLLVLSTGTGFFSIFQTSFLLAQIGIDYVAFYPYLFIGSILINLIFMTATKNRKMLKWFWAIFTIGLIWWFFLFAFSSWNLSLG
jgi:hypothetical protein